MVCLVCTSSLQLAAALWRLWPHIPIILRARTLFGARSSQKHFCHSFRHSNNNYWHTTLTVSQSVLRVPHVTTRQASTSVSLSVFNGILQNRIPVSPLDGTPRCWAPLTRRSPTVVHATGVRLFLTGYRCCCSEQVPLHSQGPQTPIQEPLRFPTGFVWMARSVVAMQHSDCVCTRAPRCS